MPLRHVAPSPPQLPGSLHRLRKEQQHRRHDFQSGHAYEDGSESIEAIICRRWILFAGFVARMEDTIRLKYAKFGELVGSACCVRGREKSERDVSWMTSERSVSTPSSGQRACASPLAMVD